jgi:Bacterial regulatory proteins, gntR family/Aminotransferase class I and II
MPRCKVASGAFPPQRCEGWSRSGKLEGDLPFAKLLQLSLLDVEALIRSTPVRSGPAALVHGRAGDAALRWRTAIMNASIYTADSLHLDGHNQNARSSAMEQIPQSATRSSGRAMAPRLLEPDRGGRTPLAVQIYDAIRGAIVAGRLVPGARLPSWRDLAVQLGVSRGTVRVAYERLINEQLAIGKGAAGTRVAENSARCGTARWLPEAPPLPELFYGFGVAPLAFQMGVPSQDAFPSKLWSRILSHAARRAAVAPVAYPDPRGEPDLRSGIAAYLCITRGVRCNPFQVLVTTGFSGALGLAIRGLELDGLGSWMEEPVFPITRTALGLAGMTVAAVPVDPEGLDVAAGVRNAPGTALAVVTPSQQAPLGMTMSIPRRLALIGWARRNGAWIVEDDYLSELKLEGRAALALASLDSGLLTKRQRCSNSSRVATKTALGNSGSILSNACPMATPPTMPENSASARRRAELSALAAQSRPRFIQ